MAARNTLAQVRSKGMKETKYQLKSWVSGVDTDGAYAEAQTPVQLNDDDSYYTQTVFYTPPDAVSQTYEEVANENVATSDLAYERWEKLSKAIYFDTGACVTGKHIWDGNAVSISGW